MEIKLSPRDGSSRSNISVQEAARDLKMVSIDVKSNFSGGLTSSKKLYLLPFSSYRRLKFLNSVLLHQR